MKKLIILLLTFFILISTLTACGYDPYKQVEKQTNDEGNILSQVLYNKDTEQTWVYKYIYDKNGNLSNIIINIYDKNGKLITTQEENTSNDSLNINNNSNPSCSNTNNSNNITLPDSPGPENDNKVDISTTSKILLDEKDVKITLQRIEKDDLFEQTSFVLLIENNSKTGLYFRTSHEYIDNYNADMSLGFGASSELYSGRKEIVNMTLYKYELEDLNIINPSLLEFDIEIYFTENPESYDWIGNEPDIFKSIIWELN